MGIRIAATGSYVPERILTNADLEKIVDTSDEWIRTRTGIGSRHIAAADEYTSDLAFAACSRALERGGYSGRDVSAIIVATTTPDFVFPNTASLLQRRLGAEGAFCIDLSSACTGLISSLEVGIALLAANRRYQRILVCGAEKLSCITDWQDRNTCVLFGDGAGAVLLERVDDGTPDTLLASELHADGSYAEVLSLPGGGSRHPFSEETLRDRLHYIHMAGRETFKLAVNSMTTACQAVMERAGVSAADLHLAIPHQANSRIILAVAQRLGLREEQLFMNIEKYGNTSAASIGICLDEVVTQGLVSRGDLLLLASFGGGLTWGAMLLRY